jgi:hypothetical protein
MADDGLDNSVIAVVGGENAYNMKLVNTLTRFLSPEQIFRPLTLRQMYDFAATHTDQRPIILLDILDFDLVAATDMVGKIRADHPGAVFMLWINKAEYAQREEELPREWAARFTHYFKLYKANEDPEDVEFEPVLRRRLMVAVREATSSAKKHMPGTAQKTPTSEKIFISYAHADWPNFVSGLAKQLSNNGFGVWVDQHLLVGGSDWVDSIAQALEECKVLILVMTPESLASRYVKMEYRYFFNYDKPIIPLLYKPIKNVPVELMSTQYIDFQKATDQAYAQLFQAIKQYIPT